MRRHHLLLLPAAVLAAALASCAPTPPDPKDTDVTTDSAKATIDALYRASTDVIGTDGWEEKGQWFDCSTPDTPGVRWQFFASRLAPLDDPADAIARAQEAWKALGYDVTVERDDNLTPPRLILSDPPYLSGTRPDGSYYRLMVGDGLAYFRGTSACIPGDIEELYSESPSP